MEVWKDVKGYEGLYKISNYGDVKSVNKNYILKKSIDSCGYYCVGLKKLKSKIYRTHVLMAINFLDHKPNGHIKVIDHINNNKLDNNIDNIQVITQRENTTKDRKSNTKLGVSFYNNKYYVRIYYKSANEYLGRYDDEDYAHMIYLDALSKIKQNTYTPKERRKKTSKYIGVSLHKKSGKWIAYCKGKNLGTFNTEIEAYNTYLKAKSKK